MGSTQRFAKDVLRLASGTAVAQAITVLAAPVVTRLYGPTAFGISALFISMTTVGIAISCLRYEVAIPLSETEEEGASLLLVSIMSCIAVSGLTALLLLVAGRSVLTGLRAPELINYIWLIPVAILAGGSFTALSYWMTRQGRFGAIAQARVARSGTIVSWQLTAGYGGYPVAKNLIFANIAGSLGAGVLLAARIGRAGFRAIGAAMTRHSIVASAKRFRKFPIYSTWSTLLNNLSWQLPTLLLSYFFSAQVVGYYALSASLLGLPMNLVGNSIGQVFFQAAATADRSSELRAIVGRTFRHLVRLAMFPLFVLGLVGRDLFGLVFGRQWAEAGVYTQMLCIWIFFWFISSPLSTLLSVFEKQEFELTMNVALIGTRSAALAIGGYLGSARLSIALFSITGVLIYGFAACVFLRLVKYPIVDAATVLLKYFGIFLPVAAVLLGLEVFGHSAWVRLAAAALAVTGYTWIVLGVHKLAGALRERIGLA